MSATTSKKTKNTPRPLKQGTGSGSGIASQTPAYSAKCPPPGVYRGIPDSQYHSWKALNASLLKSGNTEREWKHAMENPRPQTGAMRFGTMVHIATLQPSVFDGLNLVEVESYKSPTTNRVRKLSETSSDDYFTEADAECGGIAIVPGWLEKIEAIQKVIDGNKYASELMGMVPDDSRELSIVWDHPKLGVRCKARIDALGFGPDRDDGDDCWPMIDLKTTRLLGMPFAHQASKLGYHISMAHYCDAVHFGMGIDRKRIRPVFLGLLKEPVIDCQVLWLSPEFLDVGRIQLQPLVLRYVNAVLEDRWPGYFDGDLPEMDLQPPYTLMSKFHGGEI